MAQPDIVFKHGHCTAAVQPGVPVGVLRMR
jgi:hypothetical protein